MIEMPGDLLTTLIQLFRYASRRPSLRTEKKKILIAYLLQPLFPCLFALPFLMTVDDSSLHSISFIHKCPEEDHQALHALDLSPRNTPLYFF